MKIWRLYKITNRLNGKSYIGYTKNTLAWRWAAHSAGSYRNSLIYRAIRKYGKDAFEMEEICQVTSKQEAWAAERQLITSLNTFMPNGYNMTPGGDGNDAPRSPETRARMKASWYPRQWSEEAKASRIAKMTGRKHPQSQTDQQRAKMLGQKRSDAMRAKMREIGLRRTYSAETRARMSASQRGKKRSPEAVAKTAAAMKGHPVSAETKKKIWQSRRANLRRILEEQGQTTLLFQSEV